MTSKILPLRRVFRVINGGTPTPDAENWDGEIPWATPADFGVAFGPLMATRRTLTLKGATAGSSIVPARSILLSTRAPIGYVAITEGETAFNQGCRALVPVVEADSRFFGYQLEAVKEQLQARGLGTTFLELSSGALAQLPVVVPDVDEQRRIADFLDAETARIDALAAKRRQMSRLLALKRDRTIDTELGFDGRASIHRLVPLKYLVAQIVVGIVITPAKWYVEDGGVPALRGLNVQPGRIVTDDLVHISEEGHGENLKSRLQTGDVVIVRTGQAGAAAVVPASLDGANCIDLILVRPGIGLSPKYLEYVLNSDYARERISEHAVGSIQAHFNVGAMKQIPVPSISRAEQGAIVHSLDGKVGRIDRLLKMIEAQETLLAERRTALITAAVTGQIDVSTASGRGIED